MSDQESRDNFGLKESSGWFAAGASFRRALLSLSDGAFKLFAHLCLEADRHTGRLEVGQAQLARAVAKSRRIVGKYVEELEHKGVCTVQSGSNQHARTCIEIRDEYWPYRRNQEIKDAKDPVRNDYVEAIKNAFVSLGCTVGRFSAQDVQLAQDLERRGISLGTIQNALLVGAIRKYIAWLNAGSAQPIGSLAYFAALVTELQERPLAADYKEYLRRQLVQLADVWAKEAVKRSQNRGCLDIPRSEIVQ